MSLKRMAIAAVLAITAEQGFGQILTGDTRLACEAILCLASGSRPEECRPSLERYFGISYKKWSDTRRGRRDFLKQCPTANENSEMEKLADAISEGAGRCDSASLNTTMITLMGDEQNQYRAVLNQMPAYCYAYLNNPYTDQNTIKPIYVGVPERGGFWVEQADYTQALAIYNARIKAEDEAKSQTPIWNANR